MKTNTATNNKKSSKKSNNNRTKTAKAASVPEIGETAPVEEVMDGEHTGIEEMTATDSAKTDTIANDVDVMQMLSEGVVVPCVYVSMEKIIPSPYNARTIFNEKKIAELSESIKIHGVMQPIQLRPVDGSKYQIVFGERRFRAAQMLEMKVIPAQIKESTEQEAIEMGLSENLQRDDISDFEWGAYFKWLIEEKGYTVKGLVDRCNRTENFIRTRLRLTELIQEFVQLLAEDEITLNHAMELCKYEKGQQQEVYENHFKDPYFQSWRNLKPKKLAGGLANLFLTKLDAYKFDKTECGTCHHNSAIGVLFAELADCPSCGNRECLSNKNAAHLAETIISVLKADEDIDRTVLLSSDLPDRKLAGCLDKEGIEYEENESEYNYTDGPERPDMPEKDDYDSDEDLSEAMLEYESLVEDYNNELAGMNEHVKKGEMKKHLFADSSGIQLLFSEVEIEEEEDEEEHYDDDDNDLDIDTETGEIRTAAAGVAEPVMSPAERERIERICKQKTQDHRNFEIMQEHVIDNVKSFTKQAQLDQGSFTEAEEKMFFWTLLTWLDSKYYSLFGIDSWGFLRDGDKLQIVNNLTPWQKVIIMRNFTMSHLKDGAFRDSDQSCMFRMFCDQHIHDKYQSILAEHRAIYEKRHEGVIKRLKDLGCTDLPENAALLEHYDSLNPGVTAIEEAVEVKDGVLLEAGASGESAMALLPEKCTAGDDNITDADIIEEIPDEDEAGSTDGGDEIETLEDMPEEPVETEPEIELEEELDGHNAEYIDLEAKRKEAA